VFVVGAAALGIEIAAVRLLAPYFGASEVVWANTIGVVLVALSAGYWIGGKIGDRRPYMSDLCTAVMIGSVLTALLPFVARPLLDVGVDALDSVSAGAFIGSLLATLVLLAVPVLVLGTVSPWALRIGIEKVDKLEAGTLAGRLYALGTVGSLTGTLLCALVFVPGLGTRRTFLLFALLLALVGIVGVAHRLRWSPVPIVIAALFILPQAAIKPDSAAGKVIFEDESASQYLRVIEGASGSRTLELNEGQSRHSFYQPGTVLTDDVWDAALVLPLATTGEPPARLAILGNAAGTTARAYAYYFPQTKVDGVDIDGELADVGRKYFGLRDKNFTAYTADARPYLRSTKTRYDALVVDAYRQPYIPFYLTTREFFSMANDRLRPNGSIIVNAAHPEGSELLERVLAATMAKEFRYVSIDRTRPTNSMLVASDSPIEPGNVIRGTEDLPSLAPTGAREAARLTAAPTDGTVYTDDKAPVEWLIDRSIVQYAAGEGSSEN
jgi:spermidine synthase